MTGVQEPVFYRGEHVGDVTKYSDRLLIMLLKRHIPEYRDRYQPPPEQPSGTLRLSLEEVERLEKLSPESRRKLREVLEELEGLGWVL